MVVVTYAAVVVVVDLFSGRTLESPPEDDEPTVVVVVDVDVVDVDVVVGDWRKSTTVMEEAPVMFIGVELPAYPSFEKLKLYGLKLSEWEEFLNVSEATVLYIDAGRVI